MNKKLTNDIDLSMQEIENMAKKSQKILFEQTGCLLKTNDPSVIDICTSEIISAKFDQILLNFLSNFKEEIGRLIKTNADHVNIMCDFIQK